MADTQANSTLGDLLESIRDYDLNKRTYAAILKHLEAENRLNSSDFEKLLKLCLNEYNKKNIFAISSLKILLSILKKVDKEHNNSSGLLALLVAVLNNLKTNASLVKITALKALCFEIVLSFPDKCLITAVDEYANEFYIVMEQYSLESSVELVEQIIILTLKLLQILPAAKKRKFIGDGINTWFSSLIPTIFNIAKDNSSGLNAALELLGVLSKELQPEDYVENKHFKTFLSNLPSEYVSIICNILNEGRDHWAPLWIAMINLLKVNITASTLNALLQVAENAFKNNPKNRSLAFECWNYFIDNFSSQSQRILNRRIKLLAVPLLSFNAKFEETAFAKLGTWWHFIVRLYDKCDLVTDYIQPFLTFCFGSPPPSNQQPAPGMFSRRTKMAGLQAFANILGPCDCPFPDELERLQTAVITGELLVKENKNLLHYFSVALDLCVELESEEGKGYLICAWKSLLLKICGLPSETFRREEMFNELLDVLAKSLQKCCFNTSEIIINELIPALFELDEETATALVGGEAGVFRRIQDILADSCNNNFYLSCDVDKTSKKIGAFTDYATRNGERVGLDNSLETLPSSESGVLLWTCYVESTIKYRYFSNSQWIVALVMWPIKQNIISNIEKYSATWITFYDLLDEENVTNESNTKITHSVNDKLLLFLSGNRSATTPLRLTSVVSLIKQDLNERGASLRKPEHLTLKILSKQMSDELISPTIYWHLLDCLKALIDVFVLHKDVVEVKKLLLVANTTLKVTPKILSTLKAEDTDSLRRVECFLKSIHNLIKLNEYSKLSVIIEEGMKRVATHLAGRTSVLSNPVKIIFSSLISHEDRVIKRLVKKMSPDDEAKETTRKSTNSKDGKKSVNIVNTVVENGEAFVRIESNWKFNPKKLTEHQKEQFQRKREDIPALYQDLSQSQDEIKLRTWKADPTETTSSSKSFGSSAADNVTRTDPAVPEVVKPNVSESAAPNNSDIAKVTPKIKDSNSPRVLLKDRVTRNVKNLAEKSCSRKDGVSQLVVVCEKLSPMAPTVAKPNSENALDSAASVSSTKEQICSNDNVANSKSPLPIAADRPSRKRKPPNKYINAKIFGFTRRSNHSTNSADSIRNSDPSRKSSDDSLKLADETSGFTDKDPSLDTEDAPRGDKREVATPKTVNQRNAKESGSKSFKKSGSKESRIKRLLAIDMVKPTVSIVRIDQGCYATRNKSKMTPAKSTDDEAATECRPAPDPASQDVIESSQDSSVPAVSVVTTKNSANRATLSPRDEDRRISDFRDSFEDTLLLSDDERDSDLPENATVPGPNLSAERADSEVFVARTDLTEALDTEPADTQCIAHIDDGFGPSETNHCLESSTQDTAEADTKPVNFTIDIIKEEVNESFSLKENESKKPCPSNSTKHIGHADAEVASAPFVSSVDAPPTAQSTEPEPSERRDEASSPLEDDERRRRDFLDDTLDISPIGTMSPLMRERTPSPETSGDYVVVNLTSSVLLNGEPADPVDSPEVFTEDKLSPDAGHPSPPRGEAAGSEGGSGSGFSLRRKPRVRPAGRAAQMLGLCVDDADVPSPDETSRSTVRNLKRLADVGSSDEADDGEPFLRLGRVLPAVDSSPCGPILKRKRAVIAEDSTPSPAGKRKRVSFHDPPVSTSVCVKKYIDPCALRSPQGASRRPDRPDGSLVRLLGQSPASQRRLDKILAKTVESILSGSSDVSDAPSGRTPPAETSDPSDIGDRSTECEGSVDIVASDPSSPERPLRTRSEVDPRKADEGIQSDVPEVASASSQTDDESRSGLTSQTNPDVAMASDERGPDALSATFVRGLLRDKEKMAEFVVSLLRESFETKDAIAFWCDILKTITDGA
ncbi:telomere-associated protein RIF1 isoform X2 [Pieris rapae]|uniref:telomere-associated protein RIF1 isoform X2 n=1 Tax=Pieris rapae TaxID=64459 RepID=UPI001E28180D|nr:telomere-associated protein RIF1 isoform X2 [Pieris rapae]